MTQYHGHIYQNLGHGVCIANNGNNTKAAFPTSIATVTYGMVNWSIMLEDAVESDRVWHFIVTI